MWVNHALPLGGRVRVGWVLDPPVRSHAWGRGLKLQGNPGSLSGPEGQPDAIFQDTMLGEIVFTCALTGAPFGGRIGRVGEVVFPINNASSFTIPTNGCLYLTVP
ncbi:MAG TPA: hypothetical protein VLA49_12890 [Anaerolineales bacterium]|nr:hypothetical protein [Anaerolineales bacterium]